MTKKYAPFIFILTCLLGCLNNQLLAQAQGKVYMPFQTPVVTNNALPLGSPWCGGVNATQLNLADLNQDGKKDLILFDINKNGLLKTFLNIGVNGEIKYAYHPEFEKNFPKIDDYLLMLDYNCDGITDLFHKGVYGVSVFKGYYQNNELKFNFYKDLFFPGFNGPVNVYVQPSDVPSILDVDEDGDIDVLAFDVLGANLVFYRNMAIEDGLPCDTMKMTYFEKCWGKFYQGINRAVSTGITCKGSEGSNKKTRHTGNCIVHFDIDGDQDIDMVGGNISFDDVQVLYNGASTLSADVIIDQDTLYNKNGHKVQMPTWPVPAHLDIDHDGDKDLLFSPHFENLNSANYHAVSFYKNTGTDLAPNFVYQHDSLLTPDMIDVGSNSYPTFFDFDKDGKKDLFIGTEGYLDNQTKNMISKLAYYRNTSTLGNISFELITKDFLNLSSQNLKGLFPTFGDVTGDGVDDLVMGNIHGSISVYKNFTNSSTVAPNFLYLTDSIPNITVTSYSMPVVFDFNEDGKTDLLVGNKAGTLAYYEDTSSNNNKKLALKTISIGNFKAGADGQFFGYAAPFFGKMDNTGKDFLVIGNIDGTLERYDSIKNNFGAFNQVDSNYSMIQTTGRSVPAIADIDGDGKYDMVVGNDLGGVSYYKQVLDVALGLPYEHDQEINCAFFPNPTNQFIQLILNEPIQTQEANLTLYDICGRKMFTQQFITQTSQQFDIISLPAGLYLAELSIGNKKVIRKICKK